MLSLEMADANGDLVGPKDDKKEVSGNTEEGDDNSGEGKKDCLHTKDGEEKHPHLKRRYECAAAKKSPVTGAKLAGIAMKLGSKPKDTTEILVQEKKSKLAIFNNSDSDSEEEMPLECKMKMRNIGRDTITSSGPKSYNKGKR